MTMHTTTEFIGFDIETKPRPYLVERFAKPFPEFDESAVKCGNLKDPAKITAKLAEARADHEGERIAYWKTQRERASLNPFTGSIVVIGLISWEGGMEFLDGSERDILTKFWGTFTANGKMHPWVFWSGCGSASKMFDLDYIVTRSRIVGVRVPPQVRNGRFYSSRFVDLASEFLLYQNDQYLKLTVAADILGLYGGGGEPGPVGFEADQTIFPKRDDEPVRGENFWEWYEGIAQTDVPKEEQRLFALRYLRNDLLHLFHIAPRML